MANKMTKEAFVKEANKKHDDIYDYSLVSFKLKSDKVSIICNVHGIYEQRVTHHLRGSGCPTCHRNSKSKGRDKFITQSNELYGTTYDYSKVVYINNSDKVTIFCNVHQKEFTQTPKRHLLGVGCTDCLSEKTNKKRTETFISKAIEIHGHKYDYSKVEYKGMLNKVSIICKVHGIFEQTPSGHYVTSGCAQCSTVTSSQTRKNNEGFSFLKRVEKLYEGKYDYSLAKYKGNNVHIKILCPIHGEFQQTPIQHSKGVGCNKCNIYDSMTPTEYFISKSKEIHGDTYDYTNSIFTHSNNKVDIICPTHGAFSQEARNHSSAGSGCPKCVGNTSKNETVIMDHIRQLGFEVIQSNRDLIPPLEVDITIPSKKVVIEYNGLYWHSEKFGKDRNYHKNKTNLCKYKGYRLIHIWEDDFINNPERELGFIKYSLGLCDKEKIYARKTEVRKIPNKEGRLFLDKYHIQGSGIGTEYYGLYYQDQLVSVTSFLIKKSIVELTRHCSDRQVLGGLGKVSKFASKHFKQDILSFCDLSRFDGRSYLSCGYTVDKEILPDYKYVIGNARQHKFLWRKSSIKTKLPEIYDKSLTEKEMMNLAGIPRVWDCGKLRLIYKHK